MQAASVAGPPLAKGQAIGIGQTRLWVGRTGCPLAWSRSKLSCLEATPQTHALAADADGSDRRKTHMEASTGAREWGDHPEIGPGERPQRVELPNQAQSVTKGLEPRKGVAVEERDEDKRRGSDVDYLAELLAIQQSGPKDIAFFGTRNMGFLHQQLIEILSYAMVLTGNHIYTSGATGTNAAVIRGALRAEKPELLTVVLPQSMHKQPEESQTLLSQVTNVIEMPHNDHLPLIEASRICNRDIIARVRQVICFAFHDSKLLIETMQEARDAKKMVTMFFLD